jgi:Tfp pilus assembly protein PilF
LVPALFALALLATPWAQVRAADQYQPARISAAQEQKLEQARELRRTGKLDEAIGRLNEVVQENPDYYLATYNLALAYAEKNKYKEAFGAFKKAAELQRKYAIKDPTLYNSWGWAQLLAGDYGAAEQSFKTTENEFASLSPQSQQRLLNNFGVLYMYMKDYNKAETYFQRSVAEYNSSLARDNLAALKNVRRAKAAQ